MFGKRLGRALAITTIASLVITAAAFADQISNNLDVTVDADAESMTVAVGATNTTILRVIELNGDGKNGCNIQGTTAALDATVNSSDTDVATVSPSSIHVDACGDTFTLTVAGVAIGTATISLSQTGNTTAGSWDLAPATFSVNVTSGTTPDPCASVTVADPVISPAGGSSWYTTAPSPSAAAITDATIYYRVNGGTWSTTAPGALADGANILVEAQAVHNTCAGKQSAIVSETYNVDTTAPTIAYQGQDPTGWTNGSVVLTWTCTDLTSGAVQSPVTQTIVREGENQTATGTCLDVAGNQSQSTDGDADIDLTNPELNISGAASGSFSICDGAPTSPTFAPSDALSGLDGTEDDSWITPSNASGVGTYTYSAHATDLAGNTATGGRTYNVNYGSAAFSGVLQPVNADGSSRFKVGSTVPVKFRLMCGATPISNAVVALTVKKLDSSADPGVDEVVSTSAATTGNLFRYSDGQYIFNLNTKAPYTNPSGTPSTSFAQGTYTFTINLDSGEKYSFNFQLVK